MPDKNGKLSEEEFNTARQWLEKYADIPCPVCGNEYWGLSQHVIDIGPNVPYFVNAATYPSVLVVCSECGYFRFHSIAAIGIKSQHYEGFKEGTNNE